MNQVKMGFTIGLVLIGLIGLLDSCTTIKPGNVGVIFNKTSGNLSIVPAGYTFVVPFITTVQEYPVSLRTYTLVLKSGEGSSAEDDSIDLPTKEGQHIKQDISVTYNTSEAKAALVFKSFNGAGVSSIENTFIRRTIITAAQNQSGQMPLTDLISSGRDALQASITKVLSGELEKMGFVLDKINLGASHLPAAIEAQMQQKMAAQQTALQADYELQKQESLAKAAVAQSEGLAKASLIKAKAEAESNKMKQATLTPQLIQYEAVQRWDGKLPQFTGSNAVPFINVGKGGSHE